MNAACKLLMGVVASIAAFKWAKARVLRRAGMYRNVQFGEEPNGVYVLVNEPTDEQVEHAIHAVDPQDLARVRAEAAAGRLVCVGVVCFYVTRWVVTPDDDRCHVKKQHLYSDDMVDKLAEAAGGSHKLAFLF